MGDVPASQVCFWMFLESIPGLTQMVMQPTRIAYSYLAVFLYFFLFWAGNEKSNKKEEVQTRITNIFHVFLP
jgi:hypothetical protein